MTAGQNSHLLHLPPAHPPHVAPQVTMETPPAHMLPLFLSKPRPCEPLISPSVRFSVLVQYVVQVLGFCRLMLTIWIAKFLQCSAHGRFDPQVPPFGAHGGGPGEKGGDVRESFSVFKSNLI